MLPLFRSCLIVIGHVSFSTFASAHDPNICANSYLNEIIIKQGNPSEWGTSFSVWGKYNLEALPDDSSNAGTIRVFFPAGTYDPASMIAQGKPVGGTGYAVKAGSRGYECATLRYKVRFSADFEFVRGGKLPGLAGGFDLNRPRLPRGLDGFTARLMWREKGLGEVYAYLRTTPKPGTYFGTSIGRGSFVFLPGVWHTVVESIRLNDPLRTDGKLQLMLDGKMAINEASLKFRDRPDVMIDGIIFETFFGGGDNTWATPKDVSIEFSSFEFRGYGR